MLNYTINHRFGNKIYGMINMEGIHKSDTKSVIKSDIKFDISTKLTTWIGHQDPHEDSQEEFCCTVFNLET